MSLLASIRDSVLSASFPQACHVCSDDVEISANGVACSRCWLETRIFSEGDSQCVKCGAILLTAARIEATCKNCADHEYDTAHSIGVYEKALSASVLHLKRVPVIPAFVRDLILPAVERSGFLDSNTIIPVPLSSKRRIERGFNQAEVIANLASKLTGIPVDSHSLARKLHTPMHRAAMDRKAREMTVKNAFEVRRPKLIDGRSILLVDDIFTSGATVSNCAKALKKNGARSVNVFTLARAA